MFAHNQPVPASEVPWTEDEAVPASRLLNISYSDRTHALRAQDLNQACLSGVPPPGLPSWPPKSLIPYPNSSRMEGNEVGNSDNTAAEQMALRHIATAGQVQPALTSFGRDASGALAISSVPQIPPGTAVAQTSEAEVRIHAWERQHAGQDFTASTAADVSEQAGLAAIGALTGTVPPKQPPTQPPRPPRPPQPVSAVPSDWLDDVAMGAAVVAVDRSAGLCLGRYGLYVGLALGCAAIVTAAVRCR
jgi:hypothetical protein